MAQDSEAGDRISASITGDVSGQVGVGKGINQTQTAGQGTAAVSDAELAELRDAFSELKAKVLAEAPPERQLAAVERVEELEQALIAEEPDLTTVQYIGRWFGRNLPRLAGAVTGVVVNPIVGKMVGAAGDALVQEFRRLGGSDMT
jgi:tetrahydromethanopterin S-methyltransferase subunit G